MSVKAAAVSRYLGGKEWVRSEYVPSMKLRGWGHRTSGYVCEDWYDFDHLPTVRVSWLPGEGYRSSPPQEVSELVRMKVHEMAKVLGERYKVQLEEPDASFGGDPYLMVQEKVEDV